MRKKSFRPELFSSFYGFETIVRGRGGYFPLLFPSVLQKPAMIAWGACKKPMINGLPIGTQIAGKVPSEIRPIYGLYLPCCAE
jgi:hypothetical protein